jgi:hypothetical protein
VKIVASRCHACGATCLGAARRNHCYPYRLLDRVDVYLAASGTLRRAIAYKPHKCRTEGEQALRNQLSANLRELATQVKEGSGT